MLQAALQAFMVALGQIVLAYLESRKSSEDATNNAVTNAANQTLKDTGEIADAQAANNAVDRGTAADVAARLRKQLGE